MISKPMLKKYTNIDFMEKVYLIYKKIYVYNYYRTRSPKSFYSIFRFFLQIEKRELSLVDRSKSHVRRLSLLESFVILSTTNCQEHCYCQMLQRSSCIIQNVHYILALEAYVIDLLLQFKCDFCYTAIGRDICNCFII